jgi:hypothetical protein
VAEVEEDVDEDGENGDPAQMDWAHDVFVSADVEDVEAVGVESDLHAQQTRDEDDDGLHPEAAQHFLALLGRDYEGESDIALDVPPPFLPAASTSPTTGTTKPTLGLVKKALGLEDGRADDTDRCGLDGPDDYDDNGYDRGDHDASRSRYVHLHLHLYVHS